MEARLRAARLYLLLTRSLCRGDPLEVLRAALDGGVGLVQVREKHGTDPEIAPHLDAVLAVAEPFGVPVLVNDRYLLAAAAGAAGAHVGAEDERPDRVRAALGPAALLGWSTHDGDQIAAASRLPVDYLGLGPLYTTATKGIPGLSPERLGALLPAANQPVFGIGGITPDNLDRVLAAGFTRIAVSQTICGAEDPGAVSRRLSRRLEEVRDGTEPPSAGPG